MIELLDLLSTTLPHKSVPNVGTDRVLLYDAAGNAVAWSHPNELIGDGKLHANNYATLQDAYDALSAAPEGTILELESGHEYDVSATPTLDALVNKSVYGNGATIKCNAAGTFYGTRFTGTWSGRNLFRDVTFKSNGAGTHLGIVWDFNVNGVTVYNCGFDTLFQGISYSASGYPNGNFVDACEINGSSNAGISLGGEYLTVTRCKIHDNPSFGIQGGGGNNKFQGNSILNNMYGIYCDSNGVTNADHGLISYNSINHNTKAGVFIKDTLYGWIIANNIIAASNGANFGASPEDSSFGLLIQNGKGLQVQGNEFLTNKFSVGINGISKSLFNGNTFIGDPTLTQRHCYEIGGTNVSYRFEGNIVNQDLLPIQSLLQQTCLLQRMFRRSQLTIQSLKDENSEK